MDVWVLAFYLTGDMSRPIVPLAGEYISEERCMAGALQQFEHWQKVYNRRVIWRCTRTRQ